MRKLRPSRPKYKGKHRIHKAEEHRALEHLSNYLDLNEPQLIRFLVWTLETSVDVVTYGELRDICASGDVTASDMIVWRDHYAHYIETLMVPEWEKAMYAAIESSKKDFLPEQYIPSKSLFQQHLYHQSASLVTVITEDQRKMMKKMMGILGGVEGMTPYQMSQLIRPMIGLHMPQATANLNYYNKVLKNLRENHPRTSPEKLVAQAQKLARSYAEQQHRNRAVMIARTELANSYNAGNFYATKDAIQRGYLNDVVKIWCTASAERLCLTCGRMEGEVCELNAKFSCGVLYPTLHPHCRCSVIYRQREDLSFFGSVARDERGRLLFTEYRGRKTLALIRQVPVAHRLV